jgi:hypothetical protein
MMEVLVTVGIGQLFLPEVSFVDKEEECIRQQLLCSAASFFVQQREWISELL